MDKKDIHDMLFEIGGYRPDGPNNNVSGYEFEPQKSEYHKDLKIERQEPFVNPWSLEPWQQDLKNALLGRIPHRQDIFVNVMPAAGKTAPLVMAWMLSSGHNTPPKFDKICWVCPTVQLANQVFHGDLKPSFLKVLKYNVQNTKLLQLLKLSGTLQYQSPYKMAEPGSPNLADIPSEHMLPLVMKFLEHAGCLRTGSGAVGEIHKDLSFSTCTYSFAPNIIKIQQPDIVVIDELQQYFPIQQSVNVESAKQKVKEFINTLEAVPKTSSLVFLTGSMNKETATQILEFINKQFNRKLTYINAPGAKNRAYINVIPHSKLKTPQDLTAIVKDTVFRRDPGNCIVVFSVEKRILQVAEQLMKSLPQRSIEAIAGVKPNISKVFTQDDTNVNPINNSMSLNQTMDHLSKEFEHPQYIANWLQHMLNSPTDPSKSSPIYPLNQFANQYTNVSDPFLAKCILCGFGYLAGGKRRDRKMTNRDIMLVQTLFKMGKIYCLLATDMIGVGTTLTIKNLYIPTLQKRGEGGFGPIDDSSLVQLLHRTGRSPSITGNIYCNDSDFKRIVQMINSNPENSVAPAFFGKGDSLFEKKATNLYDRVSSLLRVLRET